METRKLSVETYVLDSLMVDLVGHDRRPGAYIFYLTLLRLGADRRGVGVSLQGLAGASGLSKTAIQRSAAHLARRGLIAVRSPGRTQASFYKLLQPWRRQEQSAASDTR